MGKSLFKFLSKINLNGHKKTNISSIKLLNKTLPKLARTNETYGKSLRKKIQNLS